MKLSIVVPVYNVEKYLEKCLNSLLNQDLPKEEYEIIVINDGSTDRSYTISKSFIKNNTNIILLTQVNKGLSATRNRGIKEARGTYIYFVDSDDFIAPNILKILLDTLEEHKLEMLAFNLTEVDTNFQIINEGKKKLTPNLSSIVNGPTFIAERGFKTGSYWFITKKEFLDKMGLKYVEGRMLEDIIFNAHLFPKVNRIAYLPIDVYYYLIHQESIMRNTNSTHYLKLIDDYEFALIELNKVIHTLQDKMPSKAILSMKNLQSVFLIFLFIRIMRSNLRVSKINEVIARLKESNMYPIQNYQGNLKDKLMRFVINRKVLYYPFIYFYRLFL